MQKAGASISEGLAPATVDSYSSCFFYRETSARFPSASINVLLTALALLSTAVCPLPPASLPSASCRLPPAFRLLLFPHDGGFSTAAMAADQFAPGPAVIVELARHRIEGEHNSLPAIAIQSAVIKEVRRD